MTEKVGSTGNGQSYLMYEDYREQLKRKNGENPEFLGDLEILENAYCIFFNSMCNILQL